MGIRQQSSTRRIFLLMTVLALVIVLTGAMWLWIQPSHASLAVDTKEKLPERVQELPSSLEASEAFTVHLPLLMDRFPLPPPVYGTEMRWIGSSGTSDLATQAGIYWVRFNALSWDKIEPVRTEPPTYDWDTVYEQSLQNAAQLGFEIIATVRYTPAWAQKVPGSYCGPIAQDALDEFAQFLTAAVERYSAPPYDVHYWELGNEPDVDPALVADRSVFGCWGDKDDPFYGGGYYAQMLQTAYPAIKAADPTAQVLIGGLLLDCDPTNPPSGKTCTPSKFLEGILRAGGTDYFDIVSFHGYPLYVGSLELDEQFPTWKHRGGVVLGKIDFLQEVMAAYQVQKPIIHTEGALLCPDTLREFCNPPGAAFLEAQADYVVWLYVRNWAEGLLGTVWYRWEGPGWRYGGMLDENQDPKPAYDALAFLSTELQSAVYKQPVTQYPDLRGYEFHVPGKRIWVLWAPDEQPHTITLPSNAQKALDKYGNDITPADGSIAVSSPIYVELAE